MRSENNGANNLHKHYVLDKSTNSGAGFRAACNQPQEIEQ